MPQDLDTAELDPRSFQAIADLAYRESGLILSREKAAMIQSRLRKRLQALDMSDFTAYSRFVGSDDGIGERGQLISALTTNVSHFFRESHHFDILCDKLLDNALPRLRKGGRLRIWSAGCSNGQEACSAAIRLLERAPEVADLDLRILGTDIDANVVKFARDGSYRPQDLNGVSPDLLARYFDKQTFDDSTIFRTKPQLRNLIRFNQLNLLAPWPMKGQFDVIFCRNVVIYFDPETQERLWPRFRQQLCPGGLLFLGHSERIATPGASGFKVAGPTSYAPT